jgi:hypothetical protein
MERFLLLYDEIDEYVGLLRHLVVGLAAEGAQIAGQAAGSMIVLLTALQIRLRGLN